MPPDRADILSHTSLRVDGTTSASSAADITQALQRVPGVLSATMQVESSCATVAHDPGVDIASLVVAVARVGYRATSVADRRSGAINSATDLSRWQELRNRRLVAVVLGLWIALPLLSTRIPSTSPMHWVLFALLSALWVFFITAPILGRRR
jgi:cation transport ATPase